MPTELPNERSLRKPGTLELDPSAEDLGADETVRLIAASKVAGTAVYDRQGESLGTIEAVMIDKVSGQVAYVVLSSGGFLGVGELLGVADSRRPLPWNSLTYSTELGGYVVDAAPGASDPAPIGDSGPLPAG